MQTIPVKLSEHSYDIIIEESILENAAQYIEPLLKNSQLVVISNQKIWNLHGSTLQKSFNKHNLDFSLIKIPDGEKAKCLKVANDIYNKLISYSLDRDSTLVAFGGGVVGDITGFVAATYLRGIQFIQIPTTLLAQVDSSVGGKTGINLPSGKNLVGCFYQPKLVLIDPKTLKTLPKRELQTGLSEVVKYAMIKSSKLFDKLYSSQKEKSYYWDKIIAECCQIKADIVSQDEKESHLRMILNFGHTIGHAIEAITSYKKYTHGEAVSLGMLAASSIAIELGLFSVKEKEQLTKLLQSIGLPITFPVVNSKKLISLLYNDKKTRSNKLTFILPKKIGTVEIKKDVDPNIVEKILQESWCCREMNFSRKKSEKCLGKAKC